MHLSHFKNGEFEDNVASHAADPVVYGSGTELAILGAAPRSQIIVPPIRSDAGFITHLIATAARAPQTRNLRRNEPQAAAGAYVATGLNVGCVEPSAQWRLA